MAESSIAHGPTLVAAPPASPGDRLPAGATAGDYVIERFLGAGAMGEVYAGRHPVIGKRVAIKVLRRELASSPEASERFVREARAVNQVAHASVVDVFAFGKLDDGRHYLVMDLIEGQSLRAALADGPLAVPRALAILETIAEALDAAHARGVVHRDLKPDNVMLSADTPPKVFVLDFGIAKLVAADGATGNGTLTGQGTWLGTPGYMAPEQWSADGAGPASDRYALGVTAYELLSGKLPFAAASLPGMMEQHFRTPVPALGSMLGKTTDGERSPFDEVLARAMAKQPHDRFASAREMVDALRAAASGQAIRQATPRRSWVPAAAASGVLVLSLGGVIATRGSDDGARPEVAPVAPLIAVPDQGSQISIVITSNPDGAEVKSAGHYAGATPMTLHPQAGETLALDVRKPGYRAAHRDLTVARDDKVDLTLEAIDGFQGVWRLDNGELRAFQRAGEHVDIFKLEAVTGPRVPYRTYKFVAADDGVDFAYEETITDDRGGDARCHVPHSIRYHYDPKLDALVLQRERVGVAIENGNCVVVSTDPGVRVALQRVDGSPKEIRYTEAPAGGLKQSPKPVPPNKLAKKGSASNQKLSSVPRIGKQAAPAPDQAMDDNLSNALDKGSKDNIGNADSQANNQVRARPKATPPPPDLEPQQALPQQQANPSPQQALPQQQQANPPPQPPQQRIKK